MLKTGHDPGGHVFNGYIQFEQFWQRVTQRPLAPNYLQVSSFFYKTILKDFILVAMATKILPGIIDQF